MGTYETLIVGREETLLKSPADEFVKYFTRKIHHVPVGYPAEELRFYIESTDLEERKVNIRMLGFRVIPKFYKTIKAILAVSPREDDVKRSRMSLKITFENFSYDPDDQTRFYNFLLTHIKFIDTILYQLNHKQNSIHSEFPPEECFNAFMEACQDDAEVEIEDIDLVERTTRMSLMRSTHVLMTHFTTLKVTTTITPGEGDNGSLVKWTTEAEGFADNRYDKNFFVTTATHIHDFINNKLGN